LLAGVAVLGVPGSLELALFDVIPRRWARVGRRTAVADQPAVAARLGELRQIADAEASTHVATDVGVGRPVPEILRRIHRDGHDLLIVAQHHHPARHRFASLATRKLIRRSPVPVWFDPRPIRDRRDVAVAVGPFLDERPSPDPRHLRLIELAASIATRRGGTLHVVHAWRRLLEDEASARDEFRYARSAIGKTLTACAPLPVPIEVHDQEGDVELVLREYIRDHRIADLVIGSAGRRGVAGMVIGNTAEFMLGEIKCSLLSVPHATGDHYHDNSTSGRHKSG